jgi:copper chaperone CopZ
LKVAGVIAVEICAAADGATVSIEGESSSLLSAAARSAGFMLRPAPTRSFAASGPTGDADLARLREALGKVDGIEQVDLGRHPGGAALRVTGIATGADLVAAGKSAGFALRQLGAYVAAGPSADADLTRLRAALGKVSGVESVELRGLDGGATLLIAGEVRDNQLVAAGKTVGFEIWPLSSAGGPREFKISGAAGASDQGKLREALQNVEGLGDVEIRAASDGARLVVAGGRARPEQIVEAARVAGIELSSLREAVSLPSVVPEAGRGTPPDYDERELEDQAKLGAPAPGFTLLSKDGETKLSLSAYQGKKPVVLLFGSCT